MDDNQKDISNGINPLVKVKVANLSGRSKRKVARANTVHLRGICPFCGADNMKFHKVIYMKPVKHDVWYCKKCGKTADREDLEYVKYA